MNTGAGVRCAFFSVLATLAALPERAEAQSCTVADVQGFVCEPIPLPLIPGPLGDEWTGFRARQWPANNGGALGLSLPFDDLDPGISTSVVIWDASWQSRVATEITSIVLDTVNNIVVASPASFPVAVPAGAPRATGTFQPVPSSSAATPDLGDDPVQLATGEMIYTAADLALPSRGVSFSLERTYRSRLDYHGALGHGWTHSYDQRMLPGPGLSGFFQTGDGGLLRFRTSEIRPGDLGEVDPQGSGPVTIVEYVSPPGFAGRLLAAVSTSSQAPSDWKLMEPSGVARYFRGDSSGARLRRVEDSHGLGLSLTWSNGRLTTVLDSAARTYSFHYDEAGHLTEVVEPVSGWRATYHVDARGDLVEASSAQRRREVFEYDSGHDLGNEVDYVPEGSLREACSQACRPKFHGGGGACDDVVAATRAECIEQATTVCTAECRDATCPGLDYATDCDWGRPGVPGCLAQCASGCANPEVLDEMCESAVAAPACEDLCDSKCDLFCLSNFPQGAPEAWLDDCFRCCRYGDCVLASCNYGLDCASECRKGALEEPTRLGNFAIPPIIVFRNCPDQSDDAPNCPDVAPIACPTSCGLRCLAQCKFGALTACRGQCAPNCAAEATSRCQAADFLTPCLDDCVPECVAEQRSRGPAGAKYGHLRDLDHNLTKVRNGRGELVLEIEYGDILSSPNFDTVTWQRNGEAEIELWYRDLRGEEDGVVAPPTDPAISALVVPRHAYAAPPICGFEVGALPARATVARDAFGVLSTSYFDEVGLLVRHVNHDTGAVRSYEYDGRGLVIGERRPLGGRLCQIWGDGDLLLQRVSYPTPGSSDAPLVWRFDYLGTDRKRLWHVFDPRTSGVTPLLTYEYNAGGDPIAVIDGRGERTDVVPRADGLIERVIGPLEAFWAEHRYDPATGVWTGTVLDPFGIAPVTSHVEVGSTGHATTKTDPRGLREVLHWEDGLLLNVTTFAEERHSRRTFHYLDDLPAGGTVENEEGAVVASWALERDLLGRPRRLVEETPEGERQVTCTRYRNDGRLLDGIRPDGTRHTYEYDGEGRPTGLWIGASLPDPAGWDADCAVPAHILAPRQIQAWEYDLDGNLTRINDQAGVTLLYPDGHGRSRLAKLPTGIWWLEPLDELGNPDWRAILIGATPPTAKPDFQTGPYHEMTEFSYDGAGDLVAVERWEPQIGKELTTIERAPGVHTITTHEGAQTIQWYDAAGRPLTRQLPDGTYEAMNYRADGREVRQGWVSQVAGQLVLRGRLLEIDPWGNIVKEEALATTGNLPLADRQADEFGRIEREEVAGAGVTRFGYDGLGRLTTTVREADDSTEREVLGFDSAGRVSTITSSLEGVGGGGAGAVTTIGYDELDRLTGLLRPDGKTTSFVYAGDSTRLSTETRPGGELLRWTYDAAGLPLSFTPGGSTPISRQHDALGRLRATTQVWRQHDRRGDVVNERFTEITTPYTTITTRSRTVSIGAPLTRSNVGPLGLEETRDMLGRPLSVVAKTSSATQEIARYTYHGLDGPRERVSPTAGLTTSYEYDVFGRLASMTTTRDGVEVARRVWKRTAAGAPLVEATRVGGTWRTRLFDLDSRSRVRLELEGAWSPESLPDVGPFTPASAVQAAWAAKIPEALWYRAYGLDGRGNWVTQGGSGGAWAQPVTAADAYTTFAGAAVQYDGNGQVLSIGPTTGFEYTGSGALKRATVGSLVGTITHDGTTKATGITVNSVRYAELGYLGDELLGVRLQADSFMRVVARGPAGEPIALVDHVAPQAAQILITDDQGSVYLTAGPSGVTSAIGYSAFGEPSPRAPSGAPMSEMPTPFGYHGHIQHKGLGLVLMGARWYRPAWGRFVTPDPIDILGGTNRYAFALGAPGLYSDPTGLRAEGAPGRTITPLYLLGDIMAGVAGPHTRLHALRRPLDIGLMDGCPMGMAVICMAKRVEHKGIYASEAVGWWTNLAATGATTAIGGGSTVFQIARSAAAVRAMTTIAVPAQRAGTTLGAGSLAGTAGSARTASGGVTGSWVRVAESMSDRAAAYQSRFGRAGEVFHVNGVKFDGIVDGVLQEAKGPGYATFVRNGQFRPWFRGTGALVDQARRQVAAAGGSPIQWHFAEEAAADATRALFTERGIRGIQVLFTP